VLAARRARIYDHGVQQNATGGAAAPRVTSSCQVLIVGAGPTGLTLAAQLRTFGVRFRIIDRALDQAQESRALAVQARTLELLQAIGCAGELVSRGNRSASLRLHFGGAEAASVQLGGFAGAETRFPFILFISQAETEAVLNDHLASVGVTVERGTELTRLSLERDHNVAELRHRDGRAETLRAAFVVGCDGAHSIVRKAAGIAFEGDAYLQSFMLGDVEADANGVDLTPGSLNAFAERGAMAMFFPLRKPATWRVIAMNAADLDLRQRGGTPDLTTQELPLDEIQRAVEAATNGTVRLRDPVWLSRFRLHHRQAARYRERNAFLVGDAAHIHSPVGGQGMNTGMQDAWNLGWKLALVARGEADARLLDSYEAERYPVGKFLLRYTDRAFSFFTRSMSGSAALAWARRTIIGRIVPRIFGSERLRTAAFRFVAEFNIDYRDSDIVAEGAPALRSGPKAGDRLPDAELMLNGSAVTLQRVVVGAHFSLLLCGASSEWAGQSSAIAAIAKRYGVAVHRLAISPEANALHDREGRVSHLLGIADAGQYVLRPDGYIGFRCGGTDLSAAEAYLARFGPVSFSRGLPPKAADH
jgi:2-polyprenyl-6-methoxyphenol hydroxylase-like FAD-dependent oxidoreductase